jgi:hypothetical protein
MVYPDGGVRAHVRSRIGRGHAVDQDHAHADQPSGIVEVREAER